jgi:hypothetical protein
MHSELAGSVADAAVKVRVVVAPEPDADAVNVVLPQPFVLTPAGDEIVKVGSTNATLSELINGVFNDILRVKVDPVWG